ncbi:MAG: DNA polymerase III subunit epsilon [Hyphomonadaceae bacterium JAD_PAG50586_4]|nr:MAG: DNA polymerase III subunit epsilon [Hyphomonadaceae bacterium JAD_PAG50586_4]
MREILFDTETTGVFPDHADEKLRDRVVEIGCVEVFNLERTGREFHAYVNPDRDVPEEVVRVHGLRGDFLRTQKRFGEIVADFIEFVGDAPLVAHNASFDRGFINAELRRLKMAELETERFIDTLAIARKKFPGASCSLDALARRFQLDRYGFDLASRKGPGGHGALVDSRILAEVYLHLKGGREQRLVFEAEEAVRSDTATQQAIEFVQRAQRPVALAARGSAEEAEAHAAFVAKLGDKAIWLKTGS